MILLTAIVLGLVGSLHCAGMCGPLALALPMTGNSRATFVLGRVAYNLGRIVTYCLLGAAFGLVGQTLAFAGFQRWVSIAAGSAILVGLFVSSRFAVSVPVAREASADDRDVIEAGRKGRTPRSATPPASIPVPDGPASP